MSYKEELVAYRRTRAREVLEDAKILLGSKRWTAPLKLDKIKWEW